jgi:nicotinamide riboside kinase
VARRGARGPAVSARPILGIAVIGAECTGKTTLCRALADLRGGVWVPEYLREFVDATGRAPHAHEQAQVTAEQIAREAQARRRALDQGQPLLAFDSTPLATALYSQLYFDDGALLDAATRHQRSYGLTLVTDIDLPWEPDGAQRDGPVMRARFHALLLDWLGRSALPYALLGGSPEARTRTALDAVDAA